LLELIIALALIALNGLFSLSELAVVSARKVRLTAMADQGRAGAGTALQGSRARIVLALKTEGRRLMC